MKKKTWSTNVSTVDACFLDLLNVIKIRNAIKMLLYLVGRMLKPFLKIETARYHFTSNPILQRLHELWVNSILWDEGCIARGKDYYFRLSETAYSSGMMKNETNCITHSASDSPLLLKNCSILMMPNSTY